MYQSLGIFNPTLYKFGTQFYCKSCFGKILPTRFPKIRVLKPAFSFVDLLLNLMLQLFRRVFLPQRTQRNHKEHKLKYPYIQPFVTFVKNPCALCGKNNISDNELQDFLHSFYKDKNYVERFAEHFDWILNYPWVLQEKPDAESQRYYFSSKSEQFGYEAIKFFKNNKLTAFVLLKIRDQKLTLSYIFADDDLIEDITVCILNKVLTENISILTIYDDRVAHSIKKQRKRYLFSRRCRQPFILPKTLNLTPDVFQEGDGDNVFT
jgi:hypothetical protein